MSSESNPVGDSTERSVLVIGAGPAGTAAAGVLSSAGLCVDLVDENLMPGGAITRQRFPRSHRVASAAPAHEADGIRFHGESICHGFEKGRAIISQGGELRRFDPEATIVAVGARERLRPVKGNSLPGVMACGAAQTLIKGSGSFPFNDVVVGGSGPLLLATASQLLDAGVRVVAVVEENRVALNASPATMLAVGTSIPAQVAIEGVRYLANILRRGTRMYSGFRIAEVRPGRVEIEKLAHRGDAEGRISLRCSSVVLGYGFVSASELVQQAGAETSFDRAQRFWSPRRSGAFETTVPGLYAVGDCAGVQGKEAAQLEGYLVAAHLLRTRFNITLPASEVRRQRRRYERVKRFQAAMAKLFPQPSLAGAASQAEVCRCENVTAADLEEAIEHGASDYRSAKLWTRAGMGICQGRTCHPVIADYLADRGTRQVPRVQFPVRPLPFAVGREL